MKVSIITVCLNCENVLEDTIKSVLNQTYKNIQYVIVDGESKDNTLDIIKKYKKYNNFIKYISEKDNGIYYAMNKGINISDGDIIFFLNAGDKFCDSNVVGNVVKQFKDGGYDLVYGNIVNVFKGRHIIKKYDKVNKYFLLKNSICHQCIFVRRLVFNKTNLFDTKYKICADFDWLMKCFNKNDIKMMYFDKNICVYDYSGFSSNPNNLNLIQSERYMILRKYYGNYIKIFMVIQLFYMKIKFMLVNNR